MIIGKMLNSTATLNNFIEIGSLEFLAGEQITVQVRLFDSQLDLRYIPASTNIVTFTLNKSDGTSFDVVGTHLTDDRSIVSFELSEVQTATLLGGNITFSLDILGDASEIKKGTVSNALSKVIGGC